MKGYHIYSEYSPRFMTYIANENEKYIRQAIKDTGAPVFIDNNHAFRAESDGFISVCIRDRGADLTGFWEHYRALKAPVHTLEYNYTHPIYFVRTHIERAERDAMRNLCSRLAGDIQFDGTKMVVSVTRKDRYDSYAIGPLTTYTMKVEPEGAIR